MALLMNLYRSRQLLNHTVWGMLLLFTQTLYSNPSTYTYVDHTNGCHCFLHCKCFSNYMGPFAEHEKDLEKAAFPADKKLHPYYPEDIVWHAFMKGILRAKSTSHILLAEDELAWVLNFSDYGDICLLQEYYDSIESFRKRLEQHREDLIAHYNRLYSNSNNRRERNEKIAQANQRFQDASRILNQTKKNVTDLYKRTLDECPHDKSQNEAYKKNIQTFERP